MGIPNQDRIYQGFRIGKMEGEAWVGVNKAAKFLAMRLLKGDRYKIWDYCISQKEEDGWGLSPAAIEKDIGVKKDTYYSAKSDMVQLGYLTGEGHEWQVNELPLRPTKEVLANSLSEEEIKLRLGDGLVWLENGEVVKTVSDWKF